MAKYRRYRKYSRRSHAKWSPNIQEIPTTAIQISGTTFWNSYTLSFNPIQTNTAVSQIFTVKRIECSFYIDMENSNIVRYVEDIAAYIMFVPQGMNVTQNYNLEHPEYIMAYKLLGSPTTDNATNPQYNSGQQYQPSRITTRLSRKLNTGDSIILFIKGRYTSIDVPVGDSIDFHGLVRWWTKAN